MQIGRNFGTENSGVKRSAITIKLHTVLLSGVSSQVGGKYSFPMDQRLLNIYARNRTDPIDVIEGNAIVDIFDKAQLFCLSQFG